MKPERTFVAERMLAQHCPELFREKEEDAPADLTPMLARLGDGAARALAAGLAPLLGGEAPLVRSEPVRECTMAELAETIAPLAANSVLAAGAAAAPLLVSIQAEAVLRLVDRAFGGRGDVPSPLPSAFPLSAELMVSRVDEVVRAALCQALGQAVSQVRRDACVVQLAAFPRDERLAAVTLCVDDPGRKPWTVTLGFPLATLTALFGEGERASAAKPVRAEPNPANDPFCTVPLTISAVLVDMRIGFAELSNLQPGQVLPVAVARSVPLKVGDKTIGYGTIGALDDRVAVQVTQAF
jgi:flagellar motor switch protein FliM